MIEPTELTDEEVRIVSGRSFSIIDFVNGVPTVTGSLGGPTTGTGGLTFGIIDVNASA